MNEPKDNGITIEIISGLGYLCGIAMLFNFDWRVGIGTMLVSGYIVRHINRKEP